MTDNLIDEMYLIKIFSVYLKIEAHSGYAAK